MTRWDTFAVRDGLTVSFIHEGDDSESRAHLVVAGFDDSGRPFKVDLSGWTHDRLTNEHRKNPLNRLFVLIGEHIEGPVHFCPVCERFEKPDTQPAHPGSEQKGG